MTTTAISPASSSLLAELSQSDTSCEMMIGIGLVKDSEAVYFEYTGSDGDSVALTLPSGKPLTRIAGVTVTGISIAEGIGEFESTKLNVFLTTVQGRTMLLTSGLTTWWSRCVLTGLMGLLASGMAEEPIQLDTWKGNQGKYKPCFAAIRVRGQKVASNEMYEALKEAKADKDDEKMEAICKDAALILQVAFKIEEPEVAEVTNEEEF